jgi:SAM-dependent methyltransferase
MIQANDNSDWFKDWFNSPYYHLLYNNRNTSEANHFIDNLTKYLKLKNDAAVWDLACGKGRHSIKLNELGYNVVGTDLSQESILEASKLSNSKLDFFVHDMRTPFRINYFDAVFNLFTSIGYFTDQRDNYSVFQNVHNALKPNGVFVIDFFNSVKVQSCLVANAEEKRGDLVFKISKHIKENKIIKQIKFADKGKEYNFEESVTMYSLADLLNYAKRAGFVIKETFGNYNLEKFDEQNSDRLIVIFSK